MSPRAFLKAIVHLFLWCLLCMSAVASKLSPADVAHGRKQLEKMLLDRPGMAVFRVAANSDAGYVDKSDEIFQWAISVYAGKFTGERVFWDGTIPSNEVVACHSQARSHGIFSVRIANMTASDYNAFEKMWSCFAFEILNMAQAHTWYAVESDAMADRIGPDIFVKSCARIEWSVRGPLRDFYLKTWLPWCKSHGINTKRELWLLDITDEPFESWFKLWQDRGKYPWVPFLETYKCLKMRQKYEKNNGDKKATSKSDNP